MTDPFRPPRASFAPRWALAATLAVCLVTEAVGGLLTAASVRGWYQTLRKPAWTPPDWVFMPVWTLLFLLMAVSAWLVWNRAGVRAARWGLALFLAQLALNAAWSGLFFALRRPDLAFIEIIVLWVAIAATMLSFGRVSLPAAALLAPYLVWVTYATALNGTIWWMNS
jgi:tryptophan-rich sensory protein